MSLVNWHVGRDSATIVTDSQCTQAGLPVSWQPKAFVFWHAAMVLVSRGPMDIGWLAMWDLAHRFYEGGIDGAEKLLPGILEGAYAEIAERHGGVSKSEVGLVGYSPRESVYRAVRFMSDQGFTAERQPPGNYLSPAAPSCTYPTYTKSPTAAMWLAMCEQQQEYLAREKAPEWPSVGGPLFAIEMTRAGINIKKLGVLPLYEEARAVMREREGLVVVVPSPISKPPKHVPLVDA